VELQEQGGKLGHSVQGLVGQPGQGALGLLGGQQMGGQEGLVLSGAAPERKLSQRERKLLQEQGQGQEGTLLACLRREEAVAIAALGDGRGALRGRVGRARVSGWLK
jgi:hypothetical protein